MIFRTPIFLGLLALGGAALAQQTPPPANPPAPAPAPAPANPPVTTISGTAGLNLVSGVTDSQAYNLLFCVDRFTKNVDNIHLDGGYFFSRQTSTTSHDFSVASNFTYVNGRYDRNITPSMAGYVSLGYRVDTPNNLALRSIYGAGLAYNVHGDAVWHWNLSGGIAYLTEQYSNSTPSSDKPSVAFGSNFGRHLSGNIDVSHTLSYIPAFSNFSDSVTTSLLSLGYQLNKSLKLTFNNVIDYTNAPPAGSLRKNTQWFVGLNFATKS